LRRLIPAYVKFARFVKEEYAPRGRTEPGMWPGQALAYKIGQLKILELREKAKKELGPKLDIREYHDQVLGAGALPLDVLQKQIEGWIAEKKG
jgi:uncharacterized protein (DUF885 family)